MPEVLRLDVVEPERPPGRNQQRKGQESALRAGAGRSREGGRRREYQKRPGFSADHRRSRLGENGALPSGARDCPGTVCQRPKGLLNTQTRTERPAPRASECERSAHREQTGPGSLQRLRPPPRPLRNRPLKTEEQAERGAPRRRFCAPGLSAASLACGSGLPSLPSAPRLSPAAGFL